jgi:hypothetical protein
LLTRSRIRDYYGLHYRFGGAMPRSQNTLPNDLRNYEAPTFLGMIPAEVARNILLGLVGLCLLLDRIGAFA